MERRSEAKERPQVIRAVLKAQQQIGRAARRLRNERRLTQEAAAERIGLSTIQLGRLERGQANVTLATLVACALAYRVEVQAFFEPGE